MAASEFQLDLNPESKQMLDLLERSDFGGKEGWESVSLEKLRKQLDVFYNFCKISDAYDVKREERFVPSDDVPSGIPVYVYTPRSVPPDAAILIYYHGGGLVMGTREHSDDTCTILSSQAKCIVVNVEYRLAPEHKFPAMFDDAVTVARWVLANRVSLGGSQKSKVGVSGDSAGGTLTASVAYDVPGLAFQIPVYPFLRVKVYDTPSFKELGKGPIVSEELMFWLESLIVEKNEDLDNPRLTVLPHEKFDHVPPALFIVAEFDPLRDDSYEYSKKLRAAGVESDVVLVKGAVHSFFTTPGICVETCRETFAKVVAFIDRFKST